MIRRSLVLIAAVSLVAAACSGAPEGTPEPSSSPGTEPGSSTSPPDTGGSDAGGQGCADVVDVVVTPQDGTYRFDVTVSSVETGWDKYADRWEVVGADGTVYGTRVLAHPHVDEQPFTRSESGIRIPDGVSTVVVRAHDSVAGTCGDTMTVDLPDR